MAFVGGWGEESATGKSVSFHVGVVRAGEAKLREGVRGEVLPQRWCHGCQHFLRAAPSGGGFRLGVLAEETRWF